MIDVNRNGRLQFNGTPVVNETYTYLGVEYEFLQYDKQVKGMGVFQDTTTNEIKLMWVIKDA